MRKVLAGRSLAFVALAIHFHSAASVAQTRSQWLESSPAPSWVKEIQPGTWAAISLNTLADVDPADDPEVNPNYPGPAPWAGVQGQTSVVSVWNGGAFASGLGGKGSLILFGGGHSAYYGSEVYAFDLETRRWSRLSDPYAGPLNWPYENGEYPDGSALPPHTFDFVEYHPGTNSFVVTKGQYDLRPPSNYTSIDVPHLFDLSTGKWRRGARNTNSPNLFSGGYSAYDSKRDVIWAHGGSGAKHFVSFNPNGTNGDGTVGSWETYPLQLPITNSQAEYDPENDILLIAPFAERDRVAAIDLKKPSEPYVWLQETGSPPPKEQSNGWSWSPLRRSVLYLGWSGGAVYEFKHTGGDWRTGTWTWQRISSGQNTVVPEPAAGANGVFSRFQVVRYADAEIAVVVNSIKGPVYAFRVPEPIRPLPPKELAVD